MLCREAVERQQCLVVQHRAFARLWLLGCVCSAPDFTDQHLVINGASDLLHELFGKEGDGYHARSALGFAALPTGAAVEVEAIFEVKD
jgi:enamine deaminase RidA (YjgF/YER057c/UK114 family)